MNEQKIEKAMGMIAQAKELFETSNNQFKLETLILEARYYLKKGKLENAEISLLWADKLNYESLYLYNLMGFVYKELAKENKCVECSKEEKLKFYGYINKSKKVFSKAILLKNENSNLKSIIQQNLQSLNNLQNE